LKLEKRKSAWNRAFQQLTVQALSLGTGWARANYCKTAVIIAAKYVENFTELAIFIIFTASAWVCMSVLHHRIEVERRAWDRQLKEEAAKVQLRLIP